MRISSHEGRRHGVEVHYASLSQNLVLFRWGWERGRDSISSEVQGSVKGGGKKPEKEKQNILLGALSSNSIWARQEMSAPSGVDRGSNKGALLCGFRAVP